MNITSEQNNAAGQIVELLAMRIGQNRAIHPETVIAVVARLSGSFLLRSFNFDLDKLERGAIVLSAEANEKAPDLLALLSSALTSRGIPLDTEKLGGDKSLRGEEPNLSFEESITSLQDGLFLIMQENNLDFEQAAQAATLATAFIIAECSRTIGAETALNVAVYGLIEGSKTVPPPFTLAQNT
ncbi:MAG: hypothetical protein V4448_01180 [Pseudomonadota bacterium]